MPRAERINLKITAEQAVHKFFLREMLFFFIEKRQGVILDGPFSFTAKDFSKYIEEMEFSTTLGVYINNDHIKENLKILRDSFFKRDKLLRITTPIDPLLEFNTTGTGDDMVFTISNCPTDYINNALRFLDISLMLISDVEDKERVDDLEIQRKIESINEKSLFGQTQDHKLMFCNKSSDNPLGLKERAIFNILKNNFKEEVSANDIYQEIVVQNQATTTVRVGGGRNDYVNNGIRELRKKLWEISGNPVTIITTSGRVSTYKLVY
jgi:hypothetical protein